MKGRLTYDRSLISLSSAGCPLMDKFRLSNRNVSIKVIITVTLLDLRCDSVASYESMRSITAFVAVGRRFLEEMGLLNSHPIISYVPKIIPLKQEQ